jgi:hypothetical protein
MAENWHPNYRTVEKRRQIKQTGTQRNGRDGGPRIAKPLYGLKPYRGSKETKTSMAEREGFGFQRLSAKLTPRRSPLVLDLRDRFIETADRHFGHDSARAAFVPFTTFRRSSSRKELFAKVADGV